ncbi:MAG: hypothetical protein WC152_05990 [Candidatus Izemoplasmatales bacterium]
MGKIKSLDFYNQIKTDEYHRYKSWEHCYQFFSMNRKSSISISNFSIQLFTYLASWGMLRGSSFLLQKDYLFHNEVVEEILKDKYDCLLNLDLNQVNDNHVALILELKDRIRSIYYNKTSVINGKLNSNTYPSDVLVSKILLGTLGCLPAFDRYFISGLKTEELSYQSITKKSILALKDHYVKYKNEYDSLKRIIASNSMIEYPIMKLIDMHFWQTGYEKELKQL